MRAAPLLALVAALVMAGGAGLWWMQTRATALPEGLASANGRIEIERVDIATKYAGRVAAIAVREGDMVAQGAVIAQLDTAEMRAQLASARAAVRRAAEGINQADATIAIRKAERGLTAVELHRAVELARRSAGTEAEVDRRRAQDEVAQANILGAQAAHGDAQAAHEAAIANAAQIEAVLADMTLSAPVAGRVEYRLAQPGEVLAAGGRVASLLDLSDVVMTIFLPTGEAGRVAHGSEARIVLDAAPTYVIPAKVRFVAAEAQFTPKAVETSDERQKLMYRVKLEIDPALLSTYRDYVRAGLTGQAYVQLNPAAAWPAHLAVKLPAIDG